jgi:hypothetical protein
MQAADLNAIRAIITRAKRWDLFFSLLGILSLMVGVLTFTVLFVDMAIQGVPRLSYDFFTSFPVAPRRECRHPFGLGRHHPGDAGDRAGRRAAGCRRRGLPRGIRAEELDDRHHRDQHQQPGRASRPSSMACWRWACSCITSASVRASFPPA